MRSVSILRILMTVLAVVPASSSFAGPPDSTVVETRCYSFHSDPWINLHHFLYQWARAELGLGEGRTAVPVPERDEDLPSGPAGAAWEDAVRFYVEHVGKRDHFDDDMLELKTALVGLSGDPEATPPDVIPGIREALRAAMPVYLSTWWTGHDEENRSWIAFVEPDVRAYEERWVETATRVFGGAWVEGKLRVDASAYANWQGGYTSNHPPHTVVCSRDEVGNGLYALEIVFHESGHVSSLGAPFRRTVAGIFEEESVEVPRNLRHCLLFATAGEFVRMVAEEKGLPEHVPYVVDHGLIHFSGWAPLWPPVREQWLPVVRGKADRIAALHAIAEALRPAGEGR